MHQMAHLNMIRNWVGQCTSKDFYELCDRYGILVWDEFFQANAPEVLVLAAADLRKPNWERKAMTGGCGGRRLRNSR